MLRPFPAAIAEAVMAPMDATNTLMSRYAEAGEDRDYEVVDGIALIPVQGTLLKKESFLSAWSGASSYDQIRRHALTAARVAESEQHRIHSHVNPNAGSGGVAELEAQAVALARQNRNQVTPGLYVSGSAAKVTKERAYAQMLEEHPEAYAAFRAQHNAKGLIATLEAAGIRLR